MSRTFVAQVLVDLVKTMRDFIKYNPHHGEGGRFASGDGGSHLAPDTGGGHGGGGSSEEEEEYQREIEEFHISQSSSSPQPSYRSDRAAWKRSLTDKELKTIKDYTGTRLYKRMRNCMSQGKGCSKATLDSIQTFRGMIDRAPKASGTVFRGLNLKNKGEVAAFVASVKNNGLVDKGFASVSESKSVANDFAVGISAVTYGKKTHPEKGVLLRIKSKAMVPIAEFSNFRGEKEALALPGSRMRFVGVKVDKKGLTIVDMEEE